MNSLFFSRNTGSACSLFFHCDGLVDGTEDSNSAIYFQAIDQPGGEGREMIHFLISLIALEF